ncbi:XTP/dITP diphosphatase [Clostridium tertium]|jgi:XTP/dITP diphosphohydrolase|uniref:XTP/dITP diphosphatase n=1 Tax=Clostridium TaxID=1485 RepID=UPI001157693E|nr:MULTISPECIES: XTP/dITP diphosphatase [Clostridium]MDB1922880.1 XTP/dITP diphosphatase [Clostridium tertium]MDB1925838.1 XTP/dITP diphosphatase [Clostridium tertium]MDB1929391.1 XTP/dITP diphosphatase [Clostridium tertium]MDB1933939.1 XTP/dITP diphosphatase [Clostridium tertium]MDB1937186.1 XTP/dITP diphosphatase [Clostridium tertium]
MKKLIIASNNQGKINEIKKVLNDMPINVFSLKDIGLDIDVEEDGITFEENAKKKSEEIYKELIKRGESNFIVMSDDSGLEVEYLNGEPGVYSARYAGEHGNDKKNNEKLLLNLKGVSYDNRNARFVCQLALINDKNIYKSVTGTVNGYILEEERGRDGFGYDPLFLYEPFNKTFAELTIEEKNDISHRGIALKKISAVIKEFL